MGIDDLGRATPGSGANAAPVSTARRNDPCPCGSGRRYKHCHGLPAPRSPTSAPRPARPELAVSGTNFDDIDTRVRGALELHKRGQTAAAEQIYRGVLALRDHPIAEHFLGVLLYQRRDYDAALPLLLRSTERNSTEPDFHLNLGVALLAAGRENEAVASFRRTLQLAPGHAAACNNLGLALQALNRLPEAIDAFRSAIAAAPGYAEAHWNLSLALLATGAFAEGWREYEWRLEIPALVGAQPHCALPKWDGVPQAGLRLLLRAEQGLGDAIQFARFVPLLARSGMRVTLECPPTLHRLFCGLEGVRQVVSPGSAPPAEHDALAHLPSLPLLLGVDQDSFGATRPYLSVARAEVERWRQELRNLPGRLKVGIAWGGNPAHPNDRNRSCPFDRILPLASLPEVDLVSLQLGELPASFHELRTRGRVHSFSDGITDLLDTAGLVGALDVLITVDTSIAHLAGALGKRVLVMLPFAPDWRWQLDRADSPWYPTATLLRQPAPRAWEPVIESVGKILGAMVERTGSDGSMRPVGGQRSGGQQGRSSAP